MRELDGHDPANARREVLVHGSMYTFAAAAPVLVTLFVTPVITRLLGDVQYGVVATSMLIVQVGLIVLSLGMAEAIARHGILEDSGIPGARALVVHGAWLSLAATAGIVATGSWWSEPLTGIPWQLAVLAAVIGAFLFGVITNVQAVQRAMRRPGPFVLLSMIATFGGPLLGLAAVLTTSPDANSYMTGLVGGYAVAAVVALVLMHRQGPAVSASGDIVRAVRTGAPMIAHQSSLYFATAALVVLSTHAYGVGAGGRMQLALLVGTAPAIIAMAVGNSWGPVMYRTPPEQRGAVITATARDVAAVIAILAGGVSTLSPWILRLLAPASFRIDEVVPVVALAAAGCTVAVAYLANVHLVFATGRSAGLVLIAPGAVVLAAAGVQILLPGRPIWVVGAGFPFAYVLMAIAASLLRRRIAPVSFDERNLLSWIVLGAVCALVGGIAPQHGAMSLSRLIVAAALGVLALRRLRPLLFHVNPEKRPRRARPLSPRS